MNELEILGYKIHGRIYHKPFYIIKHDKAEIYKISGKILEIFNQREKYAEKRYLPVEDKTRNIYEKSHFDQDWQEFLNWEQNIIEPVIVNIDPSELYFMSYTIINDDDKKYVRHIY